MLAEGPVKELLQKYGDEQQLEVRFADGSEIIRGENPLEQLAAMKDRGRVLGMSLEQANLEQVFLKLTGRGLRD